MNKKINVIILTGGPSTEHEVSINTGKVIWGALDKNKYNVRPIVIDNKGKWLPPAESVKLLASGAVAAEKNASTREITISEIKSRAKADVVFIAMHGKYGEDGTVQGLLEAAGIPYTGSGVLASALAMDKVRSSEIFAAHGIKVPAFVSYDARDWKNGRELILEDISCKIGIPCVVKPPCGGSSVGITIVKDKKNLPRAINKALAMENRVMIQKFIAGSEVTCAVLDDGKNPLALSPTQIIPKSSEFFDYKAKYTTGASEEITPPRLPSGIIKRIQLIALAAHKILGCAGMSRTDMIVSGEKIYVLETNTIPGMTSTSLLPQAAKVAGISLPELLDKIIESAIRRR